MLPLTELLLYESSRAQHVQEVILPLLKKGIVVLSDRFADASIAYQGYARKVDLKWVEKLNRLASSGIKPDMTILLDCPTDLGLKRALERNRRFKNEREGRFEKEQIEFHYRVRRGYLALAKKEPDRVKRIDTRGGEEKVFEKIRALVDELMELKKLKPGSVRRPDPTI